MNRIPVFVLLFAFLHSRAFAFPPNFKPDRIVSSAHDIWGKAPQGSPEARLVEQLQQHVAAADWGAAAEVAFQLGQHVAEGSWRWAEATPQQWRVTLAEIYLLNLQPDQAIAELDQVFKAIPPGVRRAWGGYASGSLTRWAAAYVMARAKAEQGNYEEAIRWLKQAPGEAPAGCGNAMLHERKRVSRIAAVWSKALLPREKAIAELGQIVRVGCAPPDPAADPYARADQQAKLHAGIEAALILGEIYLRHGDREKACEYLEKAAVSEYEIAALARAYLR